MLYWLLSLSKVTFEFRLTRSSILLSFRFCRRVVSFIKLLMPAPVIDWSRMLLVWMLERDWVALFGSSYSFRSMYSVLLRTESSLMFKS